MGRTSLARPVFSTFSKSTRPHALLVPSPSPLASPPPLLRSPSPRSTTTRTLATSQVLCRQDPGQRQAILDGLLCPARLLCNHTKLPSLPRTRASSPASGWSAI